MNPPGLRKSDNQKFPRCAYCDLFAPPDYCMKYKAPVFPFHLCDSFVSIIEKGGRQYAET